MKSFLLFFSSTTSSCLREEGSLSFKLAIVNTLFDILQHSDNSREIGETLLSVVRSSFLSVKLFMFPCTF